MVANKPKNNSWFTAFTNLIVDSLFSYFWRGIPLYFIWNYGLSQELKLPQLSFLFFFCLVAFIQILFHLDKLKQINKQIDIFYNLMLFDALERFAKIQVPKKLEESLDK